VPEVFTHHEEILQVGADWLVRLKQAADQSPLRRSRLCLHRSVEDDIQEMLIALCRDVLFRPHRHLNKTESFHVVEGDFYVIIFDDVGNVIRTVHMGPPGGERTFYYRLNASYYHAMLQRSPFVVFHETTRGPFRASEAQFAPWAPEEQSELRRFLEGRLAGALAAEMRGA
jgi:cupin fold WbuC family metalloprotein